jgi:hypothetical protein
MSGLRKASLRMRWDTLISKAWRPANSGRSRQPNSGGQRDLAVSYNNVGDVLVDRAYLKATVTHADKYGRLC